MNSPETGIAQGARRLTGREPVDPGAALQWLQEIWQYFLETGLYFAGGPSDESNQLRLQLIDEIQIATARLDDPAVNAEANRITAHVMNAAERYTDATHFYRLAIADLEAIGLMNDAARTRLGFSAALMHSGAYDEALAVCQTADQWFVEQGDDHAHARVMVNTGNIYHRLDAHLKALECQLEAAKVFEASGSHNDWAANALNLANSYCILDRFEESEAMYLRAEQLATEQGLTPLSEQARYNYAYLHFLRGRYSDAITAFNESRRRFESTSSVRHAALCDLDQSEVYLQLNLSRDASELAGRAQAAFLELGSTYEEAKATVFMGVAETQQHRYQEALDLFQYAAPRFQAEDNIFWIGMIELYRAEVLLALGRHWEARFLGESALDRFQALDIAYQTGMSLIVLGRTAMATDAREDLQLIAERLLKLIDDHHVPLLKFPSYMLCAQNAEYTGDLAEARRLFVLAAESIEENRTYLQHDELRVRFLDGKQTVYEALVKLDLQGAGDVALAFGWCERAKARALVDLLGKHLPSMRSDTNPELLDHINRLREELSSQYMRSQPGEAGQSAVIDPKKREAVQEELERGVRELSMLDSHFGSLFSVLPRPVEEIQQIIPDDVTLVEFFVARGEVLVFFLDKVSLKIHRRLVAIEKVEQMGQSLEFQMQKFALGDNYLHQHSGQMLETTQLYLRQLYDTLVAPWIHEVSTGAIVIVPHAVLHALPLHALYDGEHYLCDRFNVSYASSAEVYCTLISTEPRNEGAGLLIGHADEYAPAIQREIESLSSLMPQCQVFAGPSATRAALLEHADGARFIHISAHSFFRKDNPMFSGFNLADGQVTALDLYSQSWPCELVTLSGCSSGLAQVSAGDDLMGLGRGFLHAGARALLMSQWNVDDAATVTLVETFYRAWLAGNDKANALAQSMREVREQHPHPFYWAPFILVGASS